MDREELFLNYLNGELPIDKRKEVDEMLASDPGARERMEALKSARETVMSALTILDPPCRLEVPAFRRPHGFFRRPVFRYAAAAVLLPGMALVWWLLSQERTDAPEMADQSLIQEQEQYYEDLDYYISPNRCWNERELPVIIIKIK